MEKIIFGYNQTEYENFEFGDHQELVVGGMSDEVKNQVNAYNKEINSKVKSILKFFKLFMILFMICAVITVISFMGYNIEELESINNILFITTILFGAATVILLIAIIFSQVKIQIKLRSQEVINLRNRINNIVQNAANELEFPEETSSIDVFFSRYEIKNGKKDIIETSNLKCVLYKDNNNICIYGSYDLVSIPISSIQSITEIKSKVKLSSWNKDISIKDNQFKKYKLIMKSSTEIYVRAIYEIIIKIDDMIYKLYIPNYEIEIFKKNIN